MYRVGLTGNIASGKSAVAEEWQRLGAHVVDADMLARAAVAPGSEGLKRVEEEFGSGVIRDGELDRAALGRIVFHDAERRRALEQIIHPEVERLRAEADARAAAAGETIIVHAIPLLFETGLEDHFDAVVLVDADEAVRLSRLTGLRGLDEATARAMIAAQRPAAGKRSRSDYVIDNNGTLVELAEQASEVWSRVRESAA